jgi:hypothetical protein
MAEPASYGGDLYRLYGITLASDFPFQTPLYRAEGKPDLSFSRVWEAPDAPLPDGADAVFESRYRTEDGRPQVRLYRGDDVHLFRQTGIADWYMWSDRIVCHQHDESATELVELYFLSLLCGFWLESRGNVVLHASAVSVDDRAVVFLATNTGGKTSLATSLMRAGHPLLTDDFLAVSVPEDGEGALGHPGFPQMRMWPDLADHFIGAHEHLPHVLPDIRKRRVPVEAEGLGAFCSETRPLARLYLPAREESVSEVVLETVPAQEALIELVRESFLSTVLEKAGLHGRRFHRLATLVRRVPMKRLVYPAGLERLPAVCEAIFADLASDA